MEPNSPHVLEIERNQLAFERTLLAAERTFLSWVRTGMAGIGIGALLSRLIIFESIEHQKMGELIGEGLMLWGIVVFGLALLSYRRRCKTLTSPQRIHRTFMGLTMLTVVLMILCLMLFWIVIV